MHNLRQEVKRLSGAVRRYAEPTRYVVESYNAADPVSDREYIRRGEFPTAGAAVEGAKRLIDEQLRSAIRSGRRANDAFKEWMAFGEIPVIALTQGSGEPVEFDAPGYAEPRAIVLSFAG